jgi:hypothetical protein
MTSEGSPRTRAAFDAFRRANSLRPLPPERKKHDDECILITDADGLRYLEDGPVATGTSPPTESPPLIDDARANDAFLWAVRVEDVPIAPEKCDFARAAAGLPENKIKHSNLTGGAPAYCGGEILFINDEILVISGRSGRYGPRSEAEMLAVARAFRESGYHVLSMGWDSGAGYPSPLIGVAPRWVA